MSDIGERAHTNGGLGAKCARKTKDCNDPDSANPDSSLTAKPSTTHLCPVDFRGPPLARQWLLRIFSCAGGGSIPSLARPHYQPAKYAQEFWLQHREHPGTPDKARGARIAINQAAKLFGVAERRQWAIDQADNLAKANFPRRSPQLVPAFSAAHALHDAGVLHLKQDELEKFFRKIFFIGNVANANRTLVVVTRKHH